MSIVRRGELLTMPKKRQTPKQERRYRSIVVPLDGSRLAEQAVPLALAIAERAGAKLRLVLVSVPAVTSTARLPRSADLRRLYLSLEVQVRRSERAYLKGVADQLRKQSSSAVSSRILRGPVAEALLEYVRQSRSELV